MTPDVTHEDSGASSPQAAEPSPREIDVIEMERLLADGNFHEAGRRARALLARDSEFRSRAEHVRTAIRPDPVALVVLVASFLLLAVVSYLTLL